MRKVVNGLIKGVLSALIFLLLPCLLSAEEPEVFVQLGHSDSVTAVAFSPDSRYVLSGGNDKTIKLWEISGRLIRTFKGHTGGIDSVAFSPDGQYIISESNSDETRRKWEISSGKEIEVKKKPYIDYEDKNIISSDGKYALKTYGDGATFSPQAIEIIDNSTGRIINTLYNNFYDFAISPDSKYILLGSFHSRLILWDINSGKEIRRFGGDLHSYPLNTSGQCSVKMQAFSPDGKHILLTDFDKTLRLWDIVTGQMIKTFGNENIADAPSVVFNPDGNFVLSGGQDVPLQLWEVSTGKLVRNFGKDSETCSIGLTPDGRFAFSLRSAIGSSEDEGAIKVWEFSTGRLIKSFGKGLTYMALSHDGKFVLSSGSFLKLWDVSKDREMWSIKGHYEPLAFSPDGKFALSGSSEGNFKLWEVSKGMEMWSVKGHSEWINSIAFSPDSKYAISGGDDNLIKLWEVSTGRKIRSFIGHSDNVMSVDFSPDGKFILSRSFHDTTVRLWNVFTGKEIAQMVSFTDGEWIVILITIQFGEN